MRKLFRGLENVAVRVMYFVTTVDSYVPIAAGVLFLALTVSGPGLGAVRPVALLLAGVATYAAFKVADFHPFYFGVAPLLVLALVLDGTLDLGTLGVLAAGALLLGSATQIVFQGLPHLIASRDPSVPFRMYVNSWVTLVPTTLSLPLPWVYATVLAAALYAQPDPLAGLSAASYYVILLTGAVVVRRLLPHPPVPVPYQPRAAAPLARRVVLLNLDGVSLHALRRAPTPFLDRMSAAGAHAPTGLETVYRALTNPAFASILTGAPPRVHGVVNNNLGQPIRVEALPDLVKTKLYGSIHVKHFSRSGWDVTWFSLVGESAQRAEEMLFAKLQQDIELFPDVRLFIADISETDFCGHSYGSYSRAYHHAISKADRLVENFWSWLERTGRAEHTTVLISSDHGLFMADHSYLVSDQERFTPFVAFGAGIRPGARVETARPSIMDLNANISFLLGAPFCKESRGRVFRELYAEPVRFAEPSAPAPRARVVADA